MSGSSDRLIIASGQARLALLTQWGWGVGALGSSVMMIFANVMLLYFMVSHLGIQPVTAGIVIAVVRLIDFFVDPVVGMLSDRTRSRWGARKPWMFVGALLSGTSLAALYGVPQLDPQWQLPICVGLLMLAYYAGYSAFVVPYLVVPAEITESYDQRGALMAIRAIFAGIAGFVATGLAPYLVSEFGGDRDAFFHMALIVGSVVTLSMLVAVFATPTRVVQAGKVPTRGIQSLQVLKDRNFSVLLTIKAAALFAISANASVGLLFQVYITGHGAAGLAAIGTIQHITKLGSIPLWAWIAKRVEKRVLLISALLLYAFSTLSWAMASPAEPWLVFMTRAAIIGIAHSGVTYLIYSMLPDVMEHDRVTTGLRRDGTISGMFTAVEKASYAFAPLATGAILAWVGFTSSTGQRIEQADSALMGIVIATAVVPAVATLLSALAATQYRLTRATVSQV